MFSQKMLVVKMLGNGSCFWIGGKRSKSERGDLFQNCRIVGSLAPSSCTLDRFVGKRGRDRKF